MPYVWRNHEKPNCQDFQDNRFYPTRIKYGWCKHGMQIPETVSIGFAVLQIPRLINAIVRIPVYTRATLVSRQDGRNLIFLHFFGVSETWSILLPRFCHGGSAPRILGGTTVTTVVYRGIVHPRSHVPWSKHASFFQEIYHQSYFQLGFCYTYSFIILSYLFILYIHIIYIWLINRCIDISTYYICNTKAMNSLE